MGGGVGGCSAGLGLGVEEGGVGGEGRAEVGGS